MAKIASVPPRQVLIVDKAGRVVPVWHRFFIALEKAVNNSNEYENISKVGDSSSGGVNQELKDSLQALISGVNESFSRPQGNTTEVQFNKQGAFGASSFLTWDDINHVLSTVGVQFNLTETTTSAEGLLHWNSDDGTLDLGLPGGDVVLQIGQEVQAPRSRAVGSNITNGQLVYVSGATGSIPEMTLAKADASATASGTIAMATEDTTQNQLGYFTAFGLVRDVNTDPVTYSEGDQLYLSPTTAGGYTNVKPVPPYFIIKVGTVIRAHTTEGIIFVNISARTNRYDHIRGMTANSIPYADSDGFLTENNPDFTYDGTHQYLGADNSKVYWGAGNDISIYYDGTDAYIKTDEVAASDLNVDCGTNKTLELQTVVYEDLQVSISNVRIPTANAPTERLYNHGIVGGVTFPVLGFALNEYFYFDLQTSHSMKLSTILDNHFHYMTPTDGTGDRFKFQLDVIVAPINGTWSAPTGTPFTTEVTMSADLSNSHKIQDIADIPASNTTVSTIYKCKFTRIAASQDEYAGEVYIEFTDSHYQKNTMGSRQESAK